jgi:hypothetical protein
MESDIVQSTGTHSLHKQARRPYATCIILFFMSIVGLATFGQFPIVWSYGDASHIYRILLLPAITWICALWSVIYLARRWTAFKHLPVVVKVLGGLGSLSLIGNMFISIAMFALVMLGFVKPAGIATAGGKVTIAQTNPEVWVIDGREYRINSTYYLSFGSGLQYTIEFEHSAATTIHDDDKALEIVFPIIAHAYRNKLYERIRIHNSNNNIKPDRIGVAIFKLIGIESRGYRVAMTFDEIKSRLSESTKPTDL